MAQVTIREGLSGDSVPDSYMEDSAPTANFGSGSFISFGFDTAIKRSIFMFPLGNLPSGSVVLSAKVTVKSFIAAASAEAAKLRRITQGSWVELEVTWNEHSSGNAWSSAGGDFVTDDEADFTLPTSTGDFDIAGLKTLVDDARANRSDNLNILMMRATESGTSAMVHIFSNDYAVAADRPRLIIDYLLEDRMEPMNKMRSRIPMVLRRPPIVGTVL